MGVCLQNPFRIGEAKGNEKLPGFFIPMLSGKPERQKGLLELGHYRARRIQRIRWILGNQADFRAQFFSGKGRRQNLPVQRKRPFCGCVRRQKAEKRQPEDRFPAAAFSDKAGDFPFLKLYAYAVYGAHVRLRQMKGDRKAVSRNSGIQSSFTSLLLTSK